MSHRHLDDIADMRRRLADLDQEIASAKQLPIVDMKAVSDLKRRREELVAHLARHEEAMT